MLKEDMETQDREEDRRLKKRQAFLQEWEISVLSTDDHFKHHNQAAVEFAQSAIKSAFLLNGGGLVAIPVAMQIFDVSAKANTSDIYFASLAYIAGLLAAWLTNAGAYFSTVYFGYASVNYRDASAARLQMNYYGNETLKGDGPERLDQKARQAVTCGNILRWASIGLSIVSFAAFVYATMLGSKVILNPKSLLP